VYELDGQVLLLGVGQDDNTTIHLAENLAGVRYRRQAQVMVLENGQPMRREYGEVDHCCKNFTLVDQWLEAESRLARGPVGHAVARLMRSRDLVRVVVERLRQDETTSLHPFGVDEECDEARASIPTEE
jgi:aminoglycoside N3'-acetyltransferase